MRDEQEHWQVAGNAPELYHRYLVPAVTSMWALDLLDRADLRRGDRVLDVACGTGVVARAAAARVGLTGHVAALDINSGMLEVARQLPAVEGTTIDWHEASAEQLPFADETFDVVCCQLGLQFFPDRPGALHEMSRVLVPDGRLALNVFAPIEQNPATWVLADALDRHMYVGSSIAKRTEHALGVAEELRALVEGSGFGVVRITTERKMVHFTSVADYVRIQLTATPLGLMLSEHERDEARAVELTNALIADVGQALAPFMTGAGLTFPQMVHIVTARPLARR